jgi:hypothetical protein
MSTATTEHRAQFTTAEAAHKALFAGNATLTVVSKKTGERFTIKIHQPDPDENGRPAPFIVGLLSGPDNTADYRYMGLLKNDGVRLTAKSRISTKAPSVQGLTWLVRHVANGSFPGDKIELWHEGRCCRCGRPLTVPSSIAAGIGPDCAEKMAAGE